MSFSHNFNSHSIINCLLYDKKYEEKICTIIALTRLIRENQLILL